MYSNLFYPKTISELSFNDDLSNKLKNKNLQNFIIYGNPSSGKSTRVNCYLANKFNNSIHSTKINTYILNKSVDIIYKTSNYHIEISPGDYGTNDRLIITEFLTQIAKMRNIINNNRKVFFIKNVEKMTHKAQFELIKLIENTYNTAEYIMTCSNLNKLNLKLYSYFLLLRNPSPNQKDITKILKNIADNLEIKITGRAINIIIENSKQMSLTTNLNNIINIFQLSYITGKYLKYDIVSTDTIDKLIEFINTKPPLNKETIDKMRELIYTIYISNIDMSIVLKHILNNFMNKNTQIDEKYRIINNTSKYELLMISGNKESLYLETYILNILYNI